MESWTTRIRTGNDRTKTCSVTITPSSKQKNAIAEPNTFQKSTAKVVLFYETTKVFAVFCFGYTRNRSKDWFIEQLLPMFDLYFLP